MWQGVFLTTQSCFGVWVLFLFFAFCFFKYHNKTRWLQDNPIIVLNSAVRHLLTSWEAITFSDCAIEKVNTGWIEKKTDENWAVREGFPFNSCLRITFSHAELKDASASKQFANTEVLQVGCLQQLDAWFVRNQMMLFHVVNFGLFLSKAQKSREQNTFQCCWTQTEYQKLVKNWVLKTDWLPATWLCL